MKLLMKKFFDELPDNLKSLNSDNSKVQLYGVPNPATDQIGVYWQHSENGTLTHLAIFTLNGQLMQQIDNLPPTEPYHINISTWSAGYYFMVATFSDGSKKIFKIVKNNNTYITMKRFLFLITLFYSLNFYSSRGLSFTTYWAYFVLCWTFRWTYWYRTTLREYYSTRKWSKYDWFDYRWIECIG